MLSLPFWLWCAAGAGALIAFGGVVLDLTPAWAPPIAGFLATICVGLITNWNRY